MKEFVCYFNFFTFGRRLSLHTGIHLQNLVTLLRFLDGSKPSLVWLYETWLTLHVFLRGKGSSLALRHKKIARTFQLHLHYYKHLTHKPKPGSKGVNNTLRSKQKNKQKQTNQPEIQRKSKLLKRSRKSYKNRFWSLIILRRYFNEQIYLI